MAVQAFLMAGHDPKIANPFVRKQLFAKQTRCIFNKDRVCGVEFGKRLLIFALAFLLEQRGGRPRSGPRTTLFLCLARL